MGLGEFLSNIFSPITKTVEKVHTNRTKIKERNIERIMSADDKVAEWEMIQAEQSQFSWKDEFWTIVLAIPLVGAFIPPIVPYIQEGFRVISEMPTFYQYWVGVSVLASFGIKWLKK